MEPSIQELLVDNPDAGSALRVYLREAAQVRDRILACTDLLTHPANAVGAGPRDDLAAEVERLRQRAEQLLLEQTKLDLLAAAELDELEARERLGAALPLVLGEVDRKRRIAAYSECIEETATNAITRKSTELTKRVVTDQLRGTFQKELENLGFTYLPVEIQAAGGAKGALFHRLVFSNAPGVAVQTVLSEGEGRTLSLAAFLTELSTCETRSAIVFDDPVCSLDHLWRERIARRLAIEAEQRQVIVFTHDLLFLRRLADECERLGVPCHHQHVRRDGATPGDQRQLEFPTDDN